jgi:hypothetical protein
MTEPEKPGTPEDPAERLEREARELKAEAEKLEARADKLEMEAEELEAKKPIEVTVNDKYKVTLQGEDQTGLTIKQAAIDQNVPIKLDFLLSLELGGGKTENIGDDQHIKIKKGDRFLAMADDDNS